MTDKRKMELLCDEMQDRGHDAQFIEVAKNNVVMPAVCVRKGKSGINFYPSSFRNNDLPVSCLADEVEKQLEDIMDNAPDTSMFSDPEFVLAHLEMRMCKEDWNTKRLAGAVTRRLYDTDLILYMMVVLNLPLGGNGGFIVRQDYLLDLGIDEETAWKAAFGRLDPEVADLEKMLGIVVGNSNGISNHSCMVVISNPEKYYGAAAIADAEVLKKASGMLGTDFIYIIPSSIHECLAVSAESAFPDVMKGMICEINAGIVSETERLSDHPYFWDGNKLTSAGTVKLQGVS